MHAIFSFYVFFFSRGFEEAMVQNASNKKSSCYVEMQCLLNSNFGMMSLKPHNNLDELDDDPNKCILLRLLDNNKK